MVNPAGCAAARHDFRGWQAAYLTNEWMSVAAVPAIGGRIMAFNLGEYEFFFVDPQLAGKLFSPEENLGDGSMACWKNYGGDKTWPAPQGWDGPDQWPGPPDPILDTGVYELAAIEATPGAARLRMVSPAGSPTGVQITRAAEIRSGSSRVRLGLNFTNRAERRVRWSIWDVVQLRADRRLAGGRSGYDPGCVVTAPLNPNSVFLKGYSCLFGDEANPQWQADPDSGLFSARYLFEIGKVALDSRGGWIAFANTASGYAFVERFDVDPAGIYPDGGADVECWTVGRGQAAGLSYDEDSGPFLMETEVLSPFFEIEPGGSATFDIEWGACRCSGPVLAVSEAGCASELPAAERSEDQVALQGTFGVFDAGRLRLTWMDAGGARLTAVDLGPANPLELVRVAHVFDAPAGTAAAAIDVEAAGGQVKQLAKFEID